MEEHGDRAVILGRQEEFKATLGFMGIFFNSMPATSGKFQILYNSRLYGKQEAGSW